MKVFLRSPRLDSFLPEFKAKPLSSARPTGVRPKKTRVWIPFPDPVRTLDGFDLDYLFQYCVFPRSLLRFFGEWQLERRTMAMGDVIVQEASMPPCRCGIKFLFGVRVLSVQRTETEAAFTYGTLKGHPENGTNTFSICIADEWLFATVETLDRPGAFPIRIFRAVFIKPYTDYCNRRALLKMRDEFLARNPSAGKQHHSPGKR